MDEMRRLMVRFRDPFWDCAHPEDIKDPNPKRRARRRLKVDTRRRWAEAERERAGGAPCS